MSARRALLPLLVAVGVLGACTSGSPTVSRSHATPEAPSRTGGASTSASPEVAGGSAARALERLCPQRPSGGTSPPAEGTVPPVVGQLERQVEEIRGLDFTRRVPVDAVTHDELLKGLSQSFDAAYPAKLFAAKSRVWATIGAIPPGTQIREQLERFASSQVIGYYDEVSKYLVFLGGDDPTPVQRVTLAHELTHALDDQHFGLRSLDELSARCDDEAFSAALALAEGDATYVMVAYSQRYLSLEEQLGLVGESGSSTDGIAPFILREQTWPYTAGLAFVQTLVSQGGERAVDRAFRNLPVSSEQVLHPAKYPDDVPQPVDVPQLADELGSGWRDLDVQGVGEAWLSILLGLRLDQEAADEAAAGWDGGIYRAWANGGRVAVELKTVWDTTDDADGFSSAMQRWIAAGSGQAQVEPVKGDTATVLFASDTATLSALRSAA